MPQTNIEIKAAYRRMYDGLVELQRRVGDNVLWYEFDETMSSTDQVYTEGSIPGQYFPDTYGDATPTEGWNLPQQPGPGAQPGWGEPGSAEPGLGQNLSPSNLPGNSFKAPIAVPAVWVRYMAPVSVQSEDGGTYFVSYLSMRVSADEMRKLGLGHPENPDDHMSDRFAYQSKLYQVDTYEIRGWLGGQYLMVDVAGIEMKPGDLYTDPFPFWQSVSTPWGPAEQMNLPHVQPPNWMGT
jgi:hypothetical protein